MRNLLKKLMLFRLVILVIYLKKLTITQTLLKLKRKYLIIIIISILLLKNFKAWAPASNLKWGGGGGGGGQEKS